MRTCQNGIKNELFWKHRFRKRYFWKIWILNGKIRGSEIPVMKYYCQVWMRLVKTSWTAISGWQHENNFDHLRQPFKTAAAGGPILVISTPTARGKGIFIETCIFTLPKSDSNGNIVFENDVCQKMWIQGIPDGIQNIQNKCVKIVVKKIGCRRLNSYCGPRPKHWQPLAPPQEIEILGSISLGIPGFRRKGEPGYQTQTSGEKVQFCTDGVTELCQHEPSQ